MDSRLHLISTFYLAKNFFSNVLESIRLDIIKGEILVNQKLSELPMSYYVSRIEALSIKTVSELTHFGIGQSNAEHTFETLTKLRDVPAVRKYIIAAIKREFETLQGNKEKYKFYLDTPLNPFSQILFRTTI
jgi:hypothetical protein